MPSSATARTGLSDAAALVAQADQTADPFAREAFAARARRVLDGSRSPARIALLARLDAIAPRTGGGRTILGRRPYPGHGARMRLAGAIEGELAALALLEGAHGPDILSGPKLRAWLRAALVDLRAALRFGSLGEQGERERARLDRVTRAARAAGVEVPEAE